MTITESTSGTTSTTSTTEAAGSFVVVGLSLPSELPTGRLTPAEVDALPSLPDASDGVPIPHGAVLIVTEPNPSGADLAVGDPVRFDGPADDRIGLLVEAIGGRVGPHRNGCWYVLRHALRVWRTDPTWWTGQAPAEADVDGLPAVGTHAIPGGAVLVVTRDNPSSAALRRGDTVRCSADVGPGSGHLQVRRIGAERRESPGGGWYVERDALVRYVDREAVAADVKTAPADDPAEAVRLAYVEHGEAAALDALRLTVTAWQAERAGLVEQAEAATREAREATDRADRLRAEVATVRTRWRSDVETIGRTLREQADQRSWCSEYDEAADALAADLFDGDTFRDAAVRLRTFRCWVDVDAIDSEQAAEQAAERLGTDGFDGIDEA